MRAPRVIKVEVYLQDADEFTRGPKWDSDWVPISIPEDEVAPRWSSGYCSKFFCGEFEPKDSVERRDDIRDVLGVGSVAGDGVEVVDEDHR